MQTIPVPDLQVIVNKVTRQQDVLIKYWQIRFGI